MLCCAVLCCAVLCCAVLQGGTVVRTTLTVVGYNRPQHDRVVGYNRSVVGCTSHQREAT